MLVYYFVPFIVNNPYLLFQVSSGHNSVTVQNRTHVSQLVDITAGGDFLGLCDQKSSCNFSDHKDLGNHLLQ